MITTYIYLAIGLGANYLFNIYIARNLGTSGFGVYNLGLTFFNIATLMCTASLDQGLMHLTHQHKGASSQGNNTLLPTALTLGVISSLLGMLVLSGIALYATDTALARTIWLFTPAVIFFVISTLLIAAMQAQHIVGKRLFIKYLVEPAVRILCGVILVTLGFKITAPPVAIFAGLVASTLVPFIWKKQLIGSIRFGYDRNVVTPMLTFCYPLVASSIFTVAASRADIPIMGWLLSSESIALYAAALQTSAILTIILQAAETVSTSRFSAYIGSGDIAALVDEYKKSTRLSLLAGIPVFICFVCNAPLIMGWFGHEFERGATAFIILSCAQLINLATGPANPILIMSGRTRVVMANEIIYGVMIVVAIYLGCSSFNFIGAAIGVATANIVLRVIRLGCVYRYFSCHPHSAYSWKLLVSVVAPLIFYLAMGNHIRASGLVLYPLLSMLTIAGLGLHESDKRAVRMLISRWKGTASQGQGAS
jgi:O-antigen/teichoic acid export membrane protein